MKPSHLTTLLALTTAFVLAVAAFAAVPGTINYQGYLKNTDGTPVTASTSIRFSLYSSNPARNDNYVWRETKDVSPANGIYSTQLGSSTPITAPFDVPYYLGVQAGADPEMALQPLSSVPYARRAASVDAGTQTLLTGAATNKGLIVKGVAGQSANLQEWQSSTGTAVASVSPSGDLTIKGNLNLPPTTASAGIIYSRDRTLMHTYGGDSNFFAGVLAGNLTLSGSSNTGVGNTALTLNTSGYDNTAIGTFALSDNSTGFDNTATGAQALSRNSSGNYNTASGSMALNRNSAGSQNTATGFAALFYNTTGNQNTAAGESALFYNTVGQMNTADGFNALYSNTTASNNTAIGMNALFTQYFNNGGAIWYSNNTAVGNRALYANAPTTTINGIQNTALGSQALQGNTVGAYNTASGFAALYSNTNGYYNTASGVSALMLNTSGQLNTATGWGALYNNSIGNENTAFGVSALYSNTTAGQNTAIGNYALYTQSFNNSNTTWLSNNAAVGFEALRNNQPTSTSTGIENAAFGSKSLRANTTGRGNTASGFLSLTSNTIGDYNVAVGNVALNANTTASRNVAIGTGALGSQSFSAGGVQWNSDNTAVGYGALTRNQNVSLYTGVDNTAVGSNALGYNTSGSENTALGAFTFDSTTTGDANTAIGAYAGVGYPYPTQRVLGKGNTFLGAEIIVQVDNLKNTMALGYGSYVDASDHVQIGNTQVTQIGGQVGWSNLSDMRGKEDIADIPYGLNFIRSLRPVEFRLKGGNQRLDFGFIAQDIEALVGSGYNILGIGATEERKLSLRYTDFIAPIVKGMQEQQALIEAQGGMIRELKAELETLKQSLSGK